MSLRKCHFAALLLGASLFLVRASADETFEKTSTTPTAKTNQQTFASLRAGETVGDNQIQRAFLNSGTNRIAFMIPTGFILDASDPGKIVLSENTSRYFITVRLTGMTSVDANSQAAHFRELALNRFPGAKIAGESFDFAANHSGPAFNLEWVSSSGAAQSAHIAFIPCTAGVLEFSVLSRMANFKDAELYLTILMSSVRNNETGKLVIVPLPDYS